MKVFFLVFTFLIHNSLTTASRIPLYFHSPSPLISILLPSKSADFGDLLLFDTPEKDFLVHLNPENHSVFGNLYVLNFENDSILLGCVLGLKRSLRSYAFGVNLDYRDDQKVDPAGNKLSRDYYFYFEPIFSFGYENELTLYHLRISFPLEFRTFEDFLDTIQVRSRISYQVSFLLQRKLSSQTDLNFYVEKALRQTKNVEKLYLADTVSSGVSSRNTFKIALALVTSSVKNLRSISGIYIYSNLEKKTVGMFSGVFVPVSEKIRLVGGVAEEFYHEVETENGYRFEKYYLAAPQFGFGVEVKYDFFEFLLAFDPTLMFYPEGDNTVEFQVIFHVPTF